MQNIKTHLFKKCVVTTSQGQSLVVQQEREIQLGLSGAALSLDKESCAKIPSLGYW